MRENEILQHLYDFLVALDSKQEKIAFLNRLKILAHQLSPFNNEPVDCVLWIENKDIVANDYNPNTLAPMEKKLLRHSLEKDGFTQPIVTAKVKDHYVVVDGFHRHLLGKKTASLHKKLHGYLPVSLVNADSEGLNDRIASTVRHNRARGKHRVEAMSDIVRDLARQGWDDQRISQELGMDADEVLRLKQISGLAEIFSEETFSEAWTVR